MREKLYKVVRAALDAREYEIIKLRYGLEGVPAQTQLRVAEKFDISRSYISRIEKRAIEKLRKYIRQNSLDF